MIHKQSIMFTKKIILILNLLIIPLIISCGKDDSEIIVQGNISVGMLNPVTKETGDYDDSGPLFISTTNTDNFELVENDAMQYIVDVSYIHSYSGSSGFTMDLSETNIRAGVSVCFIALIDNDYSYGIPYPTEGDLIGFYLNRETFSPKYTVMSGNQNYIDIKVNREVYNFDAEISGTITSEIPGEARIIATTGLSLDPDILVDTIIGYKDVSVKSYSTSFTIPIFPYGYNVPIENVYVLALHDQNGDGIPNDGDKVGACINESLIINEGSNPEINLDLNIDQTYYENNAKIMGTVYGKEMGDVIVVAFSGMLSSVDLNNLDLDTIIGYEKIYKNSDYKNYSLSVLPLHQFPVDNIFVLALLDSNKNGLPDAGEKVGYYEGECYDLHVDECNDGDKKKPTVRLGEKNDVVTNVDIKIDKLYHENNAAITGVISGDDNGDVTIIAVANDGSEVDFSDFDKLIDNLSKFVVGYSVISKSEQSVEYTLPILPFFDLPISDVFILALIDKNGNGIPDEGEKIGYYVNESDFSALLTVPENGLSGIDFNINRTYYKYNSEINGTITFEGDDEGDVIVIAYSGESNSLDFNNPDIDSLMGYQKLTKDSSEVNYSLSLLPFYDYPIENVYVFALLDANKNGSPDDGEKFGFYVDPVNKNPIVTVPRQGLWEVDFNVDKTYYENNLRIEGVVEGDEGGDVIIIAYNGELDSFTSINNFADVDINSIVGYQKLLKTSSEQEYSLAILPFHVFPLENVSVFALLDQNGNGMPDVGEKVGLYIDSLRTTVTVENESLSGIDIDINKIIYDHNSSITFCLENGAVHFEQGDQVIVFALQRNGCAFQFYGMGYALPSNLKYIIALGTITVGDYYDSETERYRVELLPFIYDRISVEDPFAIRYSYVYAILDKNKNGMLDYGENFGFLYQWVPVGLLDFRFPYQVTKIVDGVNDLGSDKLDDIDADEKIRFFTYGELASIFFEDLVDLFFDIFYPDQD